MASVSPVSLVRAGATVQKTSPVARITRGNAHEDEELEAVDIGSQKKAARRSSKRSDGAFKPRYPQATTSSAIMAVLDNFKLGG